MHYIVIYRVENTIINYKITHTHLYNMIVICKDTYSIQNILPIDKDLIALSRVLTYERKYIYIYKKLRF